MTSSELEEWRAFHDVEPFGAAADDLRHGQQMALTANINRDTKQRPDPFSASDFMLAPVERPAAAAVEETPEQISARISSELFGV